ncbi:MAG: hypothetical protein AAGB16_02350 [Pseudomonadota bacterium]
MRRYLIITFLALNLLACSPQTPKEIEDCGASAIVDNNSVGTCYFQGYFSDKFGGGVLTDYDPADGIITGEFLMLEYNETLLNQIRDVTDSDTRLAVRIYTKRKHGTIVVYQISQ